MDDVDRASEREAEMLADALRDQARRAGLEGKKARDSARWCTDCGDKVPAVRRRVVPGCQMCVTCQARAERTKR